MHTTVLLNESVDALLSKHLPPAAVLVDGTFGRGGHARALLGRMPADARLIAFDRDLEAVHAARDIADPRFEIIHAPFSELAAQLRARNVTALHGALFDLGISSPQIDTAERGFSFMRDGPLDMRMDTSRGETASAWLARVDEHELAEVIADYGEERFARFIAKAIVAARGAAPHGRIERTGELAAIVAEAVRTRERGQHPATRTFQAIRIFINRELNEVEAVLAQGERMMAPGGRLAVISFHSLEDRIVKTFLRGVTNPAGQMDAALKRLPIPAAQLPQATWINIGKSMAPSAIEVQANPRARSARLRVAEKLQ
jgi:16S rRNA (cytosine1402-N4)-methyltransferase